MARNVETYVRASKRKGKQKWAIEKAKLDNARSLRGMYFIDPKDEEFKDIMKSARGKLEIQMPAAMPCKTPYKQQQGNLPQYCEKQDKICLYCRS